MGSKALLKADFPDDASKFRHLDTQDGKKKKAEILASGYTKTKRAMEIFCVSTFVLLLIVSCVRIITSLYFVRNVWVTLCACVLSMCIADFFSGIVHWGADTWGSLETPFVGNSIIRSFREHHLAPTAMCHHDVFETNGDNCLLTLPFMLLAAVMNLKQDSLYMLFVHNFLVLLCLWVAITNQIHKWSHIYKPSMLVSAMQNYGVILSKRDHAVHHRNPFDKYYCITNGWLNPLLASIDFWKRLEGVITFLTGETPREDDMLWTGITSTVE
jgi:ubiquitin-conjugating enzyme E2 variant